MPDNQTHCEFKELFKLVSEINPLPRCFARLYVCELPNINYNCYCKIISEIKIGDYDSILNTLHIQTKEDAKKLGEYLIAICNEQPKPDILSILNTVNVNQPLENEGGC